MGGVWKAFLAPAEARSHGELATALNRLAAHVDAVAEFEEALRLDARYLDERPASGQGLRTLAQRQALALTVPECAPPPGTVPSTFRCMPSTESKSTPLAALGWGPFFAAPFGPFAAEGLSPARVAIVYQSLYRLHSEQGELLAELSGRVRHEATGPPDLPVVGDWVAMRPRASEGRATIHAILPRRSRFSRKVAGAGTQEQVVAANVDTVFLQQGCAMVQS